MDEHAYSLDSVPDPDGGLLTSLGGVVPVVE